MKLTQDNRRAPTGRMGFGVCGYSSIILLLPTVLFAFTVDVRDKDNNPVSGFRWLVEEDNTNQSIPGALVSDGLAVDIHKSHAPVIARGHAEGNTAAVDVPDDTRYFVSVLPDAGHTMSGTTVAVGQAAVTVIVNPYPVPTAQISILAFHDIHPMNNAPEVPVEQGLAGFTVMVSDVAGQLMQDAFGNMLGTTYTVDGDGNPVVEMMGTGVVTTDETGEALIQYLTPGKYGIQFIPPAGEGWVQTTTIEGTKTIDAWVKANEPPVFVEFGPASYHIFAGFVRAFDDLATLPGADGPTGSLTGRVVYNHFAPPPRLQGYFPANAVEDAWVGLNESTSRQGVYAHAADPDSGAFTITGIPAGTYQLVTWDKHLDSIFGFNTITIPDVQGNWDIALGDVLAFAWFGTLEGSVFYDANMNGFRDPGEVGIPGQDVLLRFRDGTIYQVQPTDHMGEYAFSEVFPFFKWLVVEVDFLRFKDTGYTNVVDQGGQILPDAGWDMPTRGKLTPQPQAEVNPNTGNAFSRTEVSGSPGETLLQAMHLFLGQTNVIDWGKVDYGPGESGGISGLVYYAVTRAEDDPAFAAAEPWEPGIPRVQIALYEDADGDGLVDDLDGDGGPTLADRDNHPLGWFDGTGDKGPEDIDWNGNGFFDPGDAIQIAHTDSWDDNPPSGCIQTLPVIHGEEVAECFDNFGTWNQLRPGVFDGGFAMASHFPGGMANTDIEVDGLPPGIYIVEAATPAGYEIVKEEDKNVDYGDEFIPAQNLMAIPDFPPPPCVGDLHTVPPVLTLRGDIEAPFADMDRPLCDRKHLVHSGTQNTGVEFFFFTDVPKAARAVGFINNDLAAEFDESSPVFGEKQAPSWIPISFQDYAGNELVRVYCDEFGAYNAMLPSSYTVNVASPTGVSPQMISIILNHPGPIPDPNNPGEMITDPFFDPNYSQTPYTFNFEAGRTTYLDTPVIPVAAFAGNPDRQVDVEPPSGTPMLASVLGPLGGPIVCDDDDTITLTSLGDTQVHNPVYDPAVPGSTILITRDYGFGTTPGQVTVGDVLLNVTLWSNDTIVATVDTDTVSTGRLVVTRGDNGRSTPLGVKLHVNDCGSVAVVTGGSTYPNTPIQDAIDAAAPGTLILVGPGIYRENPIVYKNVRLQGAGAGGTIINGSPVPFERVTDWHAKINGLIASGDLIPVDAEETERFFEATETPGIFIQGMPETFDETSPGLVDGFTIMGGISGGGLYIAAYADYLEVSCNKIINNQGSFGGGITVGQPGIEVEAFEEPGFMGLNNAVFIHHNMIVKNGGINGGGGVTIFDLSHNYTLSDNLIAGNFTRNVGGGVAHLGTSDGGTIARNLIAFNEVFYGGEVGGNGGGIHIGDTLVGFAAGFGAAPPALGELGRGTGSVSILSNVIQGNLAGSDSGGGIHVDGINGEDALLAPAEWYELNIFNNMIVNNVAAFRGGGIALHDAANVNIFHNTIAHNDSTATSANAFAPGNLMQSVAQGAGITSTPHNAALAGATGQAFSDPLLINNIIWRNRSFYWDGTLNDFRGALVFNTPAYWDLQVVGGGTLFPEYCILSDTSGYVSSNRSDNPAFVTTYFNDLVTAAVLDEGGNFLTVRYPNLIVSAGNYHIQATSPAIDQGLASVIAVFPLLMTDIDEDPRPLGPRPDIGADETPAIAGGAPMGAAPVKADADDACPDDSEKTEPGVCGCGVPDDDSDGDGVADCIDLCPFTQDGTAVDESGCPLAAPVGPPAEPSDGQADLGQPTPPTNDAGDGPSDPEQPNNAEQSQQQTPADNLIAPVVPLCGFGVIETVMMSLFGFLGLRVIPRRRWD